MSDLHPLRPSIDHTPRPRAVLDLGDEDTTAVFEALGSGTARSILDALDDRPATVSDLAGELDTSLQNVHYHLGNLREAGLVTAAGTWYSSKGKEMTVYAPASERVEVRIASDAPDGGEDDPPAEPARPRTP